MDWDEERPRPQRTITVGEKLDELSVRELEARIGALEAEMERVRAEIARKRAYEAAASALFK